MTLATPEVPTSPAGLSPVRLNDADRLLCQVCGWTRSVLRGGRFTDNEVHAFAHLRADVLALRIGEGLLPLWGFAYGYVGKMTEHVVADRMGEESIRTLGRLSESDKHALFSIDGFPRNIGRKTAHLEKVGFPEAFGWCDRDVVEDVIAQQPPRRYPGVRRRCREVREIAALVARGIPTWIAAAAVNDRYAPKVEVRDYDSNGICVKRSIPERSYLPPWLREQYRVEKLPDVQERILAAMAMIARLK